jgi:hypothetical protein
MAFSMGANQGALWKTMICRITVLPFRTLFGISTYSGAKTGRSPKDKRVVKHPTSQKEIWWGPVNFPIGEHYFQINRERAKDYRLRRTGLRHLQCGIFPCKSPDRGHDLFNIDRSLVRKPGNGDSRYGICRRDEKRGLYHHELRS